MPPAGDQVHIMLKNIYGVFPIQPIAASFDYISLSIHLILHLKFYITWNLFNKFSQNEKLNYLDGVSTGTKTLELAL